MSFSILLIGAGQLGSRYLQGLATCETLLEIFVIDPNEKSLESAQLRWEEEASGNILHTVLFSQTLEKISSDIDLCLVTTTADVRLSVVEQVLSRCRVWYWVLEKVLAQFVGHINRLEQLLLNAEGAWVNTPRRSNSWHQQIYRASKCSL